MSKKNLEANELFSCADLFLDAAKTCQINRFRIIRTLGSSVDKLEVDKLTELERNLRSEAKIIAIKGLERINTDIEEPLKRIENSIKNLNQFLNQINEIREAIKIMAKVVNLANEIVGAILSPSIRDIRDIKNIVDTIDSLTS